MLQFDIHTYTLWKESPNKLINTSITSHIYFSFFGGGGGPRTFKCSLFTNFNYTIQCYLKWHQLEDASSFFYHQEKNVPIKLLHAIDFKMHSNFRDFKMLKKKNSGNSLAVQRLGLGAFTARAQVQLLVGELRSHKPHSMAKRKKKNQTQ